MNKLTTYDDLLCIYNTLLSISNHYFNDTFVDKINITSLVEKIVKLHEPKPLGSEVQIDLAVRGKSKYNKFIFLVIDSEATVIPFNDVICTYDPSENDITNIILIPKYLFKEDTEICNVIKCLDYIISGYILDSDQIISSIIGANVLQNQIESKTYDICMTYLSLYTLFDIMAMWYGYDMNDSSDVSIQNAIIDSLTSYSKEYITLGINNVVQMYKFVNSTENEEQRLLNKEELFVNCKFIEFI